MQQNDYRETQPQDNLQWKTESWVYLFDSP